VSKDRLVIDDSIGAATASGDAYRIAWFLADEDDLGGTIGDGEDYSDAELANAATDERPHIIANQAAAKTDGLKRDGRGYYWETKRAATTALRAMNLAIKNDGGPPWPEWATKAAAEGWKPPKGWKPA
jgi:hypothetical protein